MSSRRAGLGANGQPSWPSPLRVTQPEDWPYSNYLEWLGWREGTLKSGIRWGLCRRGADT